MYVRAPEMRPMALMITREGRNMARGLARSASKAPPMISVMLSGRRGTMPGLGARKNAPRWPGPVAPKAP